MYGQRFWVVIPPLLLVTCYTGMVFNLGFLGRDVLNVTFPGLLAVGSVAILYIQRAHPGTDIFNVAKAWITAYFSMTMSSNVICSGEPTLRSRPSFHRYASCAISDPRNRGYRNADIP